MCLNPHLCVVIRSYTYSYWYTTSISILYDVVSTCISLKRPIFNFYFLSLIRSIILLTLFA